MMKCKLMLTALLLAGVFLGADSNATGSTIRYVDGNNGTEVNNGKSPAVALRSIGHAIALSAPGDSILVGAGTYKENLAVPFNLTIVGSGAQTTIIDGARSGPVVAITNPSANVALSGVTIHNGSSSSRGGGGVYNGGTLLISKTTVSGNTTNDSVSAQGGLGGGIYNAGRLTLVDSTVSGNDAFTVRIGRSAYGGGIYNRGRLTIVNSTIAANQAQSYWPASIPYGGGIANAGGTIMISSTTISQNSALIHTPFGSPGTDGGGIYVEHNTGVTIQDSILAYNSSGGNCYGSVSSLGFNVSSDGTCTLHGPGEQKNINPKLGALRNNGGPTATIALAAGSPAINGGNPSGCTDGNHHRLTIDQRGHPRPARGACDVGAYNH
jgi:hypothetical protein